MAEIKGPLSALAIPIGESIAEHMALPPLQKNVRRASNGAGLLAWCVYAAITIGAVWHSPPLSVVLAWAAAVALGLLWLVVGVRGARGPVDVMAAFWAVVVGIVVVCLMWWHVYLPDDWGAWGALGSYLLRGFYIAGLAQSAMKFWLTVRGMGGRAKAPTVHPAPRGRAGDASEAQAHQAMRGGGGGSLPLDEREF